MTLFSGLGTDVHVSGDETGLQWEDYLSEVQNAVWRMEMSRGPDERSQMRAVSLLLSKLRRHDEGTSKVDTAGERARTTRLDSWCQSSPQYAGVDNLWPCEGACETRAQ